MNISGFGRVAIVTGAAAGLGLTIARSLLLEGKRVALVDIDKEALDRLQQEEFFKKMKTKTMFICADVSNVEEIHESVKEIVLKWNRIDILVNNAGIRSETALEDITLQEWNFILATNLTSSFFFSQAVISIMKEQEWGRIINISGTAGQYGSINAGAHYGVSKAGQILLTKVFARELAQYGITVNAIAPAVLNSPEMHRVDPEKMKRIIESIPVGRVGETEEVARLVSYLISESTDYVTGSTFDINGGQYMR
ncbi:SDR family NAD(P)-dependent oxidoreductase [Bacillus sp. Marseille-P3661]|uniref:SDR family NAD(P)-dependent oxidoreductase n=1 Tax=Bacillus sp. Marseille-P3661 TaxID=1936234 RepID=UPI000C861EAC|nr:SDR family NAD(P)-dependent oxidoreductase [Bacillus sp. Marseille-P3661]